MLKEQNFEDLSQGTKAQMSGKIFENIVCEQLEKLGYEKVSNKKFESLRKEEKPIYCRQYKIEENGIYGKPMKCDIVIYHPIKHSDNLMIECKYQKTKGSVDEKIPYLIENIKLKYPFGTILLIDGDGYRPGMLSEYLPNKLGGNFLEFYNLENFKGMCNEGWM